MEEASAFVAATFMTKSGSSYWSNYTIIMMAGVPANFGPNGQDYTAARMAHVSH